MSCNLVCAAFVREATLEFVCYDFISHINKTLCSFSKPLSNGWSGLTAVPAKSRPLHFKGEDESTQSHLI